MDKMLYIAASGARQIFKAQAINTQNLANASTTGFQADLAAMQSMPVFGYGYPSRVFASAQGVGVDPGKGAIQRTGRELDVALSGDGWIAVQAPDGSEAYTRAGDLRVSPSGMLETGAGHPVMGDGGPILVPDSEKLEIGSDGTVSVLPLGQSPSTMATIGRIKIVNPDPQGLAKGEDGLLRMKDGSIPEPASDVTLVSGALESSNVNLVEAMTNMIELSRKFEAYVKLLDTARDLDAASSEVMNIA
jgi:flagellar basal-body rod protein FlgF